MTAGLPKSMDPPYTTLAVTCEDLVQQGLATKELDARKTIVYRITPDGYAVLRENIRIRAEEAEAWRASRS